MPAPSPVLVTGLLVAATVLGSAGVYLGLRRIRRLQPRQLAIVGVIAAAALAAAPPVGSADIASYVAYGVEAHHHVDVYAAAPSRHVGFVEDPWRSTPSVYGPLATVEQRLAATIAGDRPLAAAHVLTALGAVTFLAIGFGLHRVTRRDPGAQARAHLLWTANPLLSLHLVSAGHVDVLTAGAVLLAVTAYRHAPQHEPTEPVAPPAAPPAAAAPATPRELRGGVALAGLALGAGVAVKATTAFPALGVAVALRAAPRRVAVVAATAFAVAVPLYLLAGPHVFDQARNASRFTSASTPWRAVRDLAALLLPASAARGLVGALALVVTLVLGVHLVRCLPSAPQPARDTLAFTLAALFAAAYALPWYDAPGYALLPLLPRNGGTNRLDRLLLAHTAVLTVAYLPGRVVPLPHFLQLALDAVRSGVAPLTLFLLFVLLTRVSRARHAAHSLPFLSAS